MLVKLSSFDGWEINERVGYSKPCRWGRAEEHMPGWPHRSFLRGAPKPLVLSKQTRGEEPFELYEKIAVHAQPSFLLESAKGQTAGKCYSFLGSGPVSVVSIPARVPGSPTNNPFQPLRQAV